MRDATCVHGLQARLEAVEGTSRVALGIGHQRLYTLGADASCLPHLASRLREGAPQDRGDIGRRQGLEYEDSTPRQQRGRQLEARVLGRGADQRDDPVLDPGQERILLRPVEPVNLVAEENRAAAFVLEPLLRLLDDLPHPRHTLGHGRKRLELAGGVVGDETGERGLARAGGPPEDARPHVAAADQLPQGFAGPEQVLLTEEVFEAGRAHAGGEGLATPPLTAPLEERGFRHGKGETGNGKRVARKRVRSATHWYRGMRDAVLSWPYATAGAVGRLAGGAGARRDSVSAHDDIPARQAFRTDGSDPTRRGIDTRGHGGGIRCEHHGAIHSLLEDLARVRR